MAYNKKKQIALLKIIVYIIIILMILLIILVLIQSGIKESVKHLFREPIKVNVSDECSFIMENLIHEIRSDGECKLECMNACYIRDMGFYEHNFIFNNQGCHDCECFCK